MNEYKFTIEFDLKYLNDKYNEGLNIKRSYFSEKINYINLGGLVSQ